MLQMSVTDHDVYEQVGDVVGDEGLNILINNAGVLPQNRDLQVSLIFIVGLSQMHVLTLIKCWQVVTPQDMRDAFETNCIAPLFLSRAFLPLLEKAATKNSDAAMGVGKAAIIQVSDDAREHTD